MVQLIYVSSTFKELPDFELDSIFDSSIRNNYHQDVTGLLLYSHASFLQVIEGDEMAVLHTYERICKGSRHHNISQLFRKHIIERDFPSRSMAVRRLSHINALDHSNYAPLFIYGFDAKKRGAKDGLALDLLKQFSVV